MSVSGCHAINPGCDEQHFIYTAAAGEVNDLTISTHSTGTFSSTYDVEDPGAVIVLSAAMTENPPGPEDPICDQISDHHVRCSALGNLASRAHTTVRLGDMDDEARVTPHVITAIFGDAGDDSISASGHVDDLHGGDGDDTVVTTDDAADDLFGDAGDDVLRTSQPLDRTVPDGGTGNDTFDFSNRGGNVTAIANNTDSGAGNIYPESRTSSAAPVTTRSPATAAPTPSLVEPATTRSAALAAMTRSIRGRARSRRGRSPSATTTPSTAATAAAISSHTRPAPRTSRSMPTESPMTGPPGRTTTSARRWRTSTVGRATTS